jgi:hypothetical protein
MADAPRPNGAERRRQINADLAAAKTLTVKTADTDKILPALI